MPTASQLTDNMCKQKCICPKLNFAIESIVLDKNNLWLPYSLRVKILNKLFTNNVPMGYITIFS